MNRPGHQEQTTIILAWYLGNKLRSTTLTGSAGLSTGHNGEDSRAIDLVLEVREVPPKKHYFS